MRVKSYSGSLEVRRSTQRNPFSYTVQRNLQAFFVQSHQSHIFDAVKYCHWQKAQTATMKSQPDEQKKSIQLKVKAKADATQRFKPCIEELLQFVMFASLLLEFREPNIPVISGVVKML